MNMWKGIAKSRSAAVCVATLLATQVVAVQAEVQIGERLNFVTCPIVRDTSTVPCWLVEYQGELYYLGIQTDVSAEFQPPWLGHQVLVEAVVSDQPRICGGIVLEPLRATPLPELDPSCNKILPAEAQYTIDFNPRPPGPSGGRLAFEGQSAAQAPAQKNAAQKDSAESSDEHSFELTFDFDRSVSFRHPRELMRVVEYAQKTSARHIRVHGNRGATLLSDGTLLVEHANTAQRRAEDVARLLGGIGLQAEVAASWSNEPLPADGTDDWRSRSVRVRVEP
jgi:outer membrane protein OmpA-like peptidoglycan-associated protein